MQSWFKSMNNISCISGFILLIFTYGCATPRGVQKTPWVGWEIRSFPDFGIELELPAQPKDAHSRYKLKIADSQTYIENTGMRSLFAGFHPSWSGSNFAEPIITVSVHIDRVSGSFFEDAGRAFNPDIQIKKIVYNNRISFLGLQKHLLTPNGDVLLIYGSLRHFRDSEPDAEDIKAIQRMISSVRPLF